MNESIGFTQRQTGQDKKRAGFMHTFIEKKLTYTQVYILFSLSLPFHQL